MIMPARHSLNLLVLKTSLFVLPNHHKFLPFNTFLLFVSNHYPCLFFLTLYSFLSYSYRTNTSCASMTHLLHGAVSHTHPPTCLSVFHLFLPHELPSSGPSYSPRPPRVQLSTAASHAWNEGTRKCGTYEGERVGEECCKAC